MTYEWMDSPGTGRNKPRLVRVKLTCGCTILLIDWPRHDGVRFGCESGQRHGYRLNWTEWIDTGTGRTGKNCKFS